MKKIIVSAFTMVIVLIACSPKTSPSTQAAASGMPEVAGTAAEDITAGETIFTTSCTKCHKAKTNYVKSHTYEEAIPVMNSMSKKSKLSQEQIEQLAAYVYSIAKK